MIVGRTPFHTSRENYDRMFSMIKKKRVNFKDLKELNIEMSKDCQDFITKLLDKNPETRLGS